MYKFEKQLLKPSYYPFIFRNDCVFCFFCHTQEVRGTIKDQRNKEQTYISKGFSTWKKAPKCFLSHQESACHKTASTYHLITPQCSDVGELIDDQITRRRSIERKYLLDVLRCLRYLARQGISLQGLDNNDNLTQLLLLMGTKDESITNRLHEHKGYKYTHHDVQNELLNNMATEVLRLKLSAIQERKFFSIIADEGTDVSNVEQLSFCLRSVDSELTVSEDFVGFYELSNIKSETIVAAIKDILMRCHLNLNNCRGQTYDGANNMMGKRSGVSTKILEEQPKALATHCQGHSLSLAIKALTNDCTILSETLGAVGEICVLVKYSPKREKMLGAIMDNIEGEIEEFQLGYQKLDKLCVTRWTIRAKCFKKVLDNYQALLELWEQSLEEKLDSDTKARIVGCKGQMQTFKFFFGLTLSHRLYSITDNLSKTLQKERMSALSGKELADLTIKTLEGMRNERDFSLFYEKVKFSANRLKEVSEPIVPRKRKRPNYSILQHVIGNKESSAPQFHPESPYDYYKPIYFEALDSIVMAIKDRFDQPAFKVFMQTEQLLLKAIKKEDVDDVLNNIGIYFSGDYDHNSLIAELQLLPTIFENNPTHLGEIVEVLKALSAEKKKLLENIITIVKIILTNGATSATPERSFSMLRRIKTWLRSRMTQKRLNALCILNDNKQILDDISLIKVANDFVGERPERKNRFGNFSEKDI